MILTVTANPLLDRMLVLQQAEWGRIHRGERVYEIAGGKGINAARAAQRLGEKAMATGFLGGYTGERIAALLDEEGIAHDFVRIASTTRAGTSLRLPDPPLTAFYDPPHRLQLRDLRRFLDRFPRLLQKARFCIIAGSMPGQNFVRFYQRLIEICKNHEVPVLLDTYGAPLKHALLAGPEVVKINRTELQGLLQKPNVSAEEMFHWAEGCRSRGTQWVLVTDGAGAVVADLDGRRFVAHPPVIELACALGSGDCVAAALAVGRVQGMPAEECLRFAVAAGSANAETADPAVIEVGRVRELAASVRLEPYS